MASRFCRRQQRRRHRRQQQRAQPRGGCCGRRHRRGVCWQRAFQQHIHQRRRRRRRLSRSCSAAAAAGAAEVAIGATRAVGGGWVGGGWAAEAAVTTWGAAEAAAAAALVPARFRPCRLLGPDRCRIWDLQIAIDDNRVGPWARPSLNVAAPVLHQYRDAGHSHLPWSALARWLSYIDCVLFPGGLNPTVAAFSVARRSCSVRYSPDGTLVLVPAAEDAAAAASLGRRSPPLPTGRLSATGGLPMRGVRRASQPAPSRYGPAPVGRRPSRR